MNTTPLNQGFIAKASLIAVLLCFIPSVTLAQNIEQVRWKNESQVRAILGEPESISSPVGTHATYSLWKYADFTVAFANQRAFHLFKKDSLQKLELQEERE